MTESTSTTATSEASAKEIKYRGGKRATLALVLALAAFGGVGYLYYIGIKIHTDTVYQLQSQSQIFQNYITTNDAAIKDLNQSISELSNKVESANTDSSKVNPTNYQLNELISLANQSILIYHDIKTTIKLLNYVKNLIEGNNNAIYVELKVAVVSDLTKLERQTPIDYALTSVKLNDIINQIDKLTPLMHGEKIGDKSTNNISHTSKWQEFLHNLQVKLQSLVQISRYTTNERLELLPEQEFLLRQGMKLDVLNARIALLQNDGKNWQYSLNNAKAKLNKYFVVDSKLQLVINQINELETLDINMVDINIDGTLKALNKLNNL